ncbi:uncharacterized protein LOC110976271 [Acanthaster planci]|uniref:Uncharacterized protein LOC110976271 n=1 Tax=Acanthaster planci TaxID=133434 RepID=A0A8B7XZ83_ACAPL|nr:uncharacterized protein LOC110976271 [Acanthaster planci]
MTNYILFIGLMIAMFAILATSSDEAAINDGMETPEDAEALNNFLHGLLQARVDRSWRKPCDGNSCFQSAGGRGWKRNRAPFSLDGFKCIGAGCERGWKRTSERKR